MITAHFATRMLVIACALQLPLLGCKPERKMLPPPLPAAVDPAAATEGERQPLRIVGEHFYLGGTRQMGSGVLIKDLFSARIGGIPLEEVARVGEGELTATVPGSLPVGTWDVEVSGPSGTGVLLGAFTVIPREICFGGVDEDGDGAIDCEDPQCRNLPCDDGNGCTINDVCTAAGTCVGGPCVPPSSCWTGGCVAGTCSLSVLVGQACDDGLSCTASDTCQVDGSCAGLNACTSPPTACHQPIGTCQANSTCSYAVATGSPCDDGAACTAGDTCTATAACVGSTYSCAPPGECFASACDGTGGCLVSPTYAAACDGGVCLGDGGCLPVVWPYQPSNFQPSNGSHPGPNLTIPSGCNMSFNSTANSWPNACPGVAPPSGTVVPMQGGGDAVLINVWNLRVDGRLNVFGDKPVIFGVFGDVLIQGEIRASTSSTNPNGYTGAGANALSCGQSAGGDGAPPSGGGGGGAFGGAGASGGGVGAGDGGSAGVPTPKPLRGGCRGGNGGGASGGRGGNSGGAVQISAGGLLEVRSLITVSGAGGKGGNASARAGGGGGGSGGMILLEGNKVILSSTSILTANGGGGGSGEGNGAGKDGQDGAESSAVPASGGTGSATGGEGGAGGAGLTPATPGQTASAGSGGGGAGVGVIIVRANPAGSCVHQPMMTSPEPVYIDCP